MALKKTSVTNSLAGCDKHIVTATDVTDTYVEWDFDVTGMPLGAQIQVTSTAGAIKTSVDAVITYPSAGRVRVTEGGTFSLVATDVITIQAFRDLSIAEELPLQ